MNILFYIASIVAIISTLLVVTRSNAVHALLFLILSLLSVAVIFFLLGAQFIAILEVIIYAGAIMVLFIFVVMMLNVTTGSKPDSVWLKPKTWILPGLFSLILLIDFISAFHVLKSQQTTLQVVTPKQVGISLFTTYLLGVELAGMLLLGGIVGAYHLGREKKESYTVIWEESNMITIPMNIQLLLAAILFLIGFAGILVRRNIIFMLMCIEIMLNSAGLVFIIAGAHWLQTDGQVMFIFILSVAAAEVSVALALVFQMHHHFKTLQTEELNKLKEENN